jgi:transposase
VLGRSESQVLWHPLFEDFARYYGFTPRACQPYRPRTKGQASYCTSLRTCGVSLG